MPHLLRKPAAFTLIELLIVVAIIGILAAIAVPNFMNARLRARIAATESNMKAIGTALEMYSIDHGKYPNTYYPGTTTFLNPRVYRFIRLTTPVAYMSASVRDVFNTMDLEPNAVYPFWGPDTMDHRRLGTWFDHPEMEPYKHQKGGWCIMSFGPDQDFESTEKQYLLVFNASNGLTSDGDLYRFGP
ncbi:MAG: prepilin-type N-terminal cleavage/methylation domain-containing protein [bacterium]|nr:prepilin-type N-terminal cleavage/methylation domain-containing protein [bacterium]